MKRKQILITGGSISTLKAIEKQINDINLITAIVENPEAAIEKFHHYYFDIAIFSNEINTEDETKLRKIFTVQNSDIVIIRQNNEGRDSLNDKINEAILQQDKNKKPFISLVDDALKNAGLNIVVQ